MIDIDELIPHRKPIKVISEALCLEDDAGEALAVVGEDWPLCNGQTVSALVLIEAIAQTAALVESHKRARLGQNTVKGWLVGIKSAEFHTERVPVRTSLRVAVRSLYSFDDYGVIEGSVTAGDDVLVTVVLQAVRFDEHPPVEMTIRSQS